MRGDGRQGSRGAPARALGFTYIGILIAVALMGIALAAIGTVWGTTVKREREQELLFIGHEYRSAIARYYRAGGGGTRYPQALEDLLNDQRSPVPRHHLRRLYRDPMTGLADWELIPSPGGGIMGVRSTSQAQPIKRANFDTADSGFETAESYKDWQFIYQPRTTFRRTLKGR